MKKLIALTTLIITNQSALAMKALERKQTDVARLTQEKELARMKESASKSMTVEERKAESLKRQQLEIEQEGKKNEQRSASLKKKLEENKKKKEEELAELEKKFAEEESKTERKMAKQREALQEKLAAKKRKEKKEQEGESSTAAQTKDQEVIEQALELITTLPEKLALYASEIKAYEKTNQEKAKKAQNDQEKALKKLDKIQNQYFELYNRNEDNETVQEITKILDEGVSAPITEAMWQALNSAAGSEDEGTGNLKHALKQVNTLIETGEKALAKEPQNAAIRKQLEPLKKERQILEKLIAQPNDMAIFRHQKELLQELDDLKAALKKAKKEKNKERKAEIEMEIEQLYKRAPHLLPAAEIRRAAQTKKFLPKNIKAYIEAKRDAILEEEKEKEAASKK